MKKSLKQHLEKSNIDGYKIALYPLILIILVIYSIFQVGLDPTIIWTEKFWLDLFLKYLIQFAWIYFGLPDGKNKAILKDSYVKTKELLQKAVTLIKDKGLLLHFRQYVKDDYLKERERFIEGVLFSNGIDKRYYELEIKHLKKNYNKYELSLLQLHIINKLKKGDFDFPIVDPNTIMSVYDVKNVIHKGQYSERRRIIKELFPKVILTFITLALASSALIDGETSIGQALWNMSVNIGLSLMSYAYAFRTGVLVIEDYTSVYEFRNNYIHTFIEQYEKGKYVPDLSTYEIQEQEIKQND